MEKEICALAYCIKDVDIDIPTFLFKFLIDDSVFLPVLKKGFLSDRCPRQFVPHLYNETIIVLNIIQE